MCRERERENGGGGGPWWSANCSIEREREFLCYKYHHSPPLFRISLASDDTSHALSERRVVDERKRGITEHDTSLTVSISFNINQVLSFLSTVGSIHTCLR